MSLDWFPGQQVVWNGMPFVNRGSNRILPGTKLEKGVVYHVVVAQPDVFELGMILVKLREREATWYSHWLLRPVEPQGLEALRRAARRVGSKALEPEDA